MRAAQTRIEIEGLAIRDHRSRCARVAMMNVMLILDLPLCG
jgi:hypothetical protein